jgi:hypothetical protein
MSGKWKFRPADHAIQGPTHAAALNARLAKAEWQFRKTDRVIHHQTAVSTGHSCACGAKATRFIAGKFDSKVWMCAGCFAEREKAAACDCQLTTPPAR